MFERMHGQFLFSTCFSVGLEVRAILRNSPRRFRDVPSELRAKGMTVGIRVFEDSELVFEDSEFACVGLNETCEVSKASCLELTPGRERTERLVVADCSLEGEGRESFSQEHQLIYENPKTGFSSALLYDQRPISISLSPSPVILIAPKVWISLGIRTLISFASASPLIKPGLEDRPLEITVLSQRGDVVFSYAKPKARNSAWILDVRRLLQGEVPLSEDPTFFTLVARGGAGSYAITTFIVVDATGTFALEHSLPPPYYVGGDIARVRGEANRFPSADPERRLAP